MINCKYKLIDLDQKGEIVVEGRVPLIDPIISVYFVPLGINAIKVWVDIANAPNARPWRSTSVLQNIEDAVGAWPIERVITNTSLS